MDIQLFAANLMSTNLKTVEQDTKFSEIKRKLETNDIHHLPVVDGTKLIGLISMNDIMQHSLMDPNKTQIENLANLDKTVTLESLMHKGVNVALPDTPLHEAAEILYMSNFNCLPVCDNDMNLVGILTSRDFVRFVKDHFKPE